MDERAGELSAGNLVLRPETGGAEGVVFDVLVGDTARGQIGVRRGAGDVGLLTWDLDEQTDPATGATAVRLLLTHVFEAGVQRVEAHVDPADLRTLRLLSHAGLRREGVLRGHAGGDAGRADRLLLARLPDDPAADSRDGFIAMLNAGLPRKRVISQLVLRDPEQRVLLCELTYKSEWDLPGGVVEPLESPATGLARELREELGVDLTVGALLTVNWLPPWRGWDDACLFVFDGGEAPAGIIARMRLQPTEIRAVHWCTPEQVAARATAATVRLLDALATRRPGDTYLEDGGAAPTGAPSP